MTDMALDAELLRLARAEHDATVALVEHLAELGARRSYLAAGFSSLFEYCRERLLLSEGEAYNRSVAARAVRKFPILLQRLADGSINLTTIRLLFKYLTTDNHGELLEAALHKSKHDVERLIAARFPQPTLPLSVRKVPSAPAPLISAPVAAVALMAAPTAIALPVAAPAPSRPVRPASASPERRGSVPRAVHGQRVHLGQVAGRARPAAPSDPERRCLGDLRPRARLAARRPGAKEVRCDDPATS